MAGRRRAAHDPLGLPSHDRAASSTLLDSRLVEPSHHVVPSPRVRRRQQQRAGLVAHTWNRPRVRLRGNPSPNGSRAPKRRSRRYWPRHRQVRGSRSTDHIGFSSRVEIVGSPGADKPADEKHGGRRHPTEPAERDADDLHTAPSVIHLSIQVRHASHLRDADRVPDPVLKPVNELPREKAQACDDQSPADHDEGSPNPHVRGGCSARLGVSRDEARKARRPLLLKHGHAGSPSFEPSRPIFDPESRRPKEHASKWWWGLDSGAPSGSP